MLLLLLLYNSGGYTLVYFNLKEIVKEYSMYVISKAGDYNSLSLLKIPKNKMRDDNVFRRMDRKEFRYNNKMYDFAKEIDNGDTVYFYCMEDKNEVILDELFAGCFTKEEDNKNNRTETKIILRFLMTEAVAAVGLLMPRVPEKEIDYTALDKKHLSFIPPVVTPPPRYYAAI